MGDSMECNWFCLLFGNANVFVNFRFQYISLHNNRILSLIGISLCSIFHLLSKDKSKSVVSFVFSHASNYSTAFSYSSYRWCVFTNRNDNITIFIIYCWLSFSVFCYGVFSLALFSKEEVK